ncbi:MAG: ActS/PrrB/RegB family redox-sensitive histidine kinase, partial [Beijerinckiaceae bacterium]
LVAMLGIIAVSATLNLALRVQYPPTHRMQAGAAVALLAFDVVQLASLLYLTGGLQNPFALLFLAPVLISATALPAERTMALGLLAMLATTLLANWHQPLPWVPGEELRLPRLYVAGVWISIMLGLAFIGVYAWRVAEESRQLGDALAATELVLAREQHLSQLDGLAAAAAHELGTPLATIALVARELDRATAPDHPLKDDITLLFEQTRRCRQILGKLTTLGTEGADLMGSVGLRLLIEEVVAPQRSFGRGIAVEFDIDGPEPLLLRSPGLVYGLENLIENAVDFATTTVTIRAAWSATEVSIAIFDDGPGFAPDVLKRMGDPYVTTRPMSERGGKGGSGLGLGLFIAKTLLERSGARFNARNLSGAARGAEVSLRWPRDSFERQPLKGNRAETSEESLAETSVGTAPA